MKTRADIAEDLKRFGLGPVSGATLAEVAVWVGAMERPALPLDRYQRHFQKLADKAAAYARGVAGPASIDDIAETLRQIVCRHYGYGCGTAESMDADCFDMTHVVDSREGASEALAILHADIARRLGWHAELLSIPGRMLVRVQALGERSILDPLADMRPVEPEDMRAIVKAASGNEAELTPAMLEPLDDRMALLKLLAGRKSMLLRTHRLEEAKALIDTSLLIAPEEPTLWRECGLMNARLDRIHDAVAALEEYLRLGPGDTARYNTSILLQELRGRLS